MTQEQKDLLIKDLRASLPYGVILNCCNIVSETLTLLDYNGLVNNDYDIDEVKPYLFPLSSMTDEQRFELYKALGRGYESHYHLSREWEDFNGAIDNNDLFIPASWVSDLDKMCSWLNKNHFDYRGLIEKGLAIDATGLNVY